MPKPAEISLPSDREVRVTRTFDAPRQLVWDAHASPALMRKWLAGHDGWDMSLCEMDVRVGGKYRWQWRNRDDGKQFGFFGTFTEVSEPSKMVHEQYYDPGDTDFAMPVGDPCVVSLEFVEQGGVTTLACTLAFASKAARDEAMSTGMTEGMEHNYKHLDEAIEVTMKLRHGR